MDCSLCPRVMNAEDIRTREAKIRTRIMLLREIDALKNKMETGELLALLMEARRIAALPGPGAGAIGLGPK